MAMGRNLRVMHNLPSCGPSTSYSMVLEHRGRADEYLLVENYAIVSLGKFGSGLYFGLDVEVSRDMNKQIHGDTLVIGVIDRAFMVHLSFFDKCLIFAKKCIWFNLLK